MTSVPLEAGQRVTIGGSTAIMECDTLKKLYQQNAQLTRRLRDLEEDNAHLRERLTRANAQLRAAEGRQ